MTNDQAPMTKIGNCGSRFTRICLTGIGRGEFVMSKTGVDRRSREHGAGSTEWGAEEHSPRRVATGALAEPAAPGEKAHATARSCKGTLAVWRLGARHDFPAASP
jgi:hypothetical protein